MQSEIEVFKNKLFQLVVAPICIFGGPLLFLLVEPVDDGGNAGLNFILIFAGCALIIVGLIAGFIGIGLLIKNQSIEISDSYIELKSQNTRLSRVTLSELAKPQWSYIYAGEGSGSLHSDIYHAIKEKGLCLQLGDNKVLIERFQNGIWKTLREKIAEKVPSMAIFARDGEGTKDFLFLVFENEDYFLGQEMHRNTIGYATDQNGIVKSLVKLRTDNDGRLFLRVLEKCNVSGLDNTTKEQFSIEGESSIDVNKLPEYEVSDRGFTIEHINVQPQKFV